MTKRLAVALLVAAVLAVGGAAVAQTAQRFSDVPPDHEAFEAVEWAADTGLTLGYGDGTFKPSRALSKDHALVFMERYYDDILGADKSEGFTRADMMVLLKAINDGDNPSTGTGPEGRWLPRPEGRIAEGRCTHTISDTDLYVWEECAWGGRPDPVQNRAAMRTLSARVWTETLTRGKPDSPPALVEGRCRNAHAAACYIPATHTISIESGVTLRSILHELAHALITGDAVMADCYADWTHIVPHCAHGALFRCAADALYVRYGDLGPAGVCGEPPDTGDWTRHDDEDIAGRWIEWQASGTADETSKTVVLAIRCVGDRLRVFAWYQFKPGGNRHAVDHSGWLAYRFGRQSAPTRAVGISPFREPLEVEDPSDLLADFAADTSERLYVQLIEDRRVWDDGRPESVKVTATLRTTGYRTHVRPFVEACG